MATYEEPLLKEGYLVKAPDTPKYLHNFRKWQRKLFRLDSRGDLYYYDNEKSLRPNGIIPMLQCLRLFNAKGKFGDQLSYCIGVELSDVTYYIKAESARTYNEWIEPLSKFADVCELNMLPEGSSDRRGTLSSEAGEGPGLRTSSVTSRHFSIATKAKFLSKEGWLAKTGGNNKGWKERYFVLANGKLTYYKNEKKDNSLGSVDLFECTGIDRSNGKKGFGFDIKVPGRVFNISSDSEASQNDWISTISHSLGLIKDIKSSSSGVPRSDSNGSENSRELAILESLAPLVDSQKEASNDRDTSEEHSSSSLPSATLHLKKEDKKESDVVQLLEVEVDALRHKVASLEDDLKSSTTANSQLQQQLSEVKSSLSSNTRQLTEERNNLQLQLEQLQKSKSELETINDSLRTQLEEHIERLQEMDEEQISLRQDLEEVQTTSTAVEEELVDTQQKLREIEEVARSLEDALRKKSESEPQTPVGISARTLSLAYQAKLESFSLPDQRSAETENKTESQLAEKLQEKLTQKETELAKLEEEIKRLKATQPAVEVTTMTSSRKGDTAAILSEERLRWQMEKENLRKELTAKMDAEREPILKEKEALENKLKVLEETSPSLTKEQAVALENSLTETQSRVQQLESEVGSQAEKISQLQVEKEKAVADLIAIRKINRTIEKKISETEVSSPISAVPTESLSINGTQDTEKEINELRSTLEQVVKERDQLKLQLDNQQSSGEALDIDAGLFRFRSKTLATVATNNRLSSGDVITARTIQNDNISPRQDNPPPKPKRPPKELLNRYSNQQEQQHQHSSGPVSILQTLFARRSMK